MVLNETTPGATTLSNLSLLDEMHLFTVFVVAWNIATENHLLQFLTDDHSNLPILVLDPACPTWIDTVAS